MMDEITKHVEILSRKAARRALEIYNTDFDVIRKTDGSPVTAADMAVNEIVSRGLSEYGWPILSEESSVPDGRVGAEYVWIVDPIDGTHGFTEKNGEFAIQIALVKQSKPIFGVVYRPTTEQYFYAHKGKGSFLKKGLDSEPQKLTVSDSDTIADSVLAISASHFDNSIMHTLTQIGFEHYIHVGGIGVRIGLMAEKKADAYLTTTKKLGEWDICAPQIILEEAGGVMTGLYGEELTYNNIDPHNPHGVLAATNLLHPVLIARLEKLK